MIASMVLKWSNRHCFHVLAHYLDLIFFQTVSLLGAISKTIEYITIKIFQLDFLDHYNLSEATALLHAKHLSLFPYLNHYSSDFP
jgi:hypothetical protein